MQFTLCIKSISFIPLLILKDPVYPLLPCLMKQYTVTPNITSTQRQFNYDQNRAQMPVENAFDRLKRQWRCLLKQMDFALENIPNVVAACVIYVRCIGIIFKQNGN